MRLLLLCALLLVGCSDGSASQSVSRSAKVKWTPVSAAQVRELCGQPYADGCVKKFGGVCQIITEPMPLAEFTGYNHDMTSPHWRALSHELMHCFGYEHA